jgi:hypothetical protein
MNVSDVIYIPYASKYHVHLIYSLFLVHTTKNATKWDIDKNQEIKLRVEEKEKIDVPCRHTTAEYAGRPRIDLHWTGRGYSDKDRATPPEIKGSASGQLVHLETTNV